MSKRRGVFGSQRSWLWPLLAACSACTGVSSLPSYLDGSDPRADSAIGGGVGASGSGSATQGGARANPSTELDAGRVVLRRLNQAEYNNTVRDLLGTTRKPADDFPPDDVAEGFDTLGSALSFSLLLAEDMESAAGTLVDELLARPMADPLRSRVMVCEPTAATAASCVPQILTGFLKRAYRRPATSAEIQDYVSLANGVQQASGDILRGVNAALKAALLAPDFLFHVELGDPKSPAPAPLNDYELASRLSYFAWSTMPDASLLTAADAGKLAPGGADFDAQIDRVLADPKAQAFIERFGSQWLSTNEVDGVAPDAALFKDFDESLRVSIAPETNLFFQSLVEEGLPLKTLLLADFSFVNARLAKAYGLPGGQTGFAKTSLNGSPRIGLLTQETFLTVTSQPDRTSPVKRGNWVLEHLLCDPPPSPPPGIPPLTTPEASSGLTVRAVLEEHRKNASCSACHKIMDPIGLGLESFDAIGAYRTMDNGKAIDASGTMPDGTSFSGATELAHTLAKDPRFTSCVMKQVLTYAVGRSFDSQDGKSYVAGLALPLAEATWPDLLHAVIKSKAFLTRRGEAL